MRTTDISPQDTSTAHAQRSTDIVTLQAHILQQQTRYPEASGQFSWILSALSISTKMIAAHVRRARLDDVLGAVGSQNVQGEQQQKLDVIANDILLRALGGREGVAIVASEENEQPIILRSDDSEQRKYCVLFDPLDGSSNLDVCGAVGTIFSILRKDRRSTRPEASLLQCGAKQVAAGYVLYGSSTVFVLTIGLGVDMFVLDPAYGAFIRVAEGLRIPPANKSYSVNEGNRLGFPQGYRDYLSWAQEQGYSSRYVGAMVADVHRILLQGGVFMYPPTRKAPDGKLRLMYEANPMAMLIEQAGGKAYCAPGQRILDIVPDDIHQRVPVVLGSAQEVDHVMNRLAAAAPG
ncbi:fructose-1,6-bisphosphatase I [Steroidobacter denitrificans]|uniref:Fructose-1,6-bisphosphatase class 1 n=1 Tax=Steroidobacter denitrificans TaxID=465721 RepID=A0A127FEE7_STEDE|nr:class 1 fructose-bisphosphatase [Steroidobacter denitrificans]AMN48261.1 fructose-1,6-bisphosphatase I [Steroidobacter denitrificans]